MTTVINAATSGGLISTADTSGILQLQTASTAAVTIDASQNVGVGTASPSYKLDVTGTTASANVLRVKPLAGSTGATVVLDIQTGGGSAIANFNNEGNVGIGTTPAAWYSGYKAIQSLNSSFVGVSDRTWIGQNWYLNAAGSDAFLGNGYAALYRQYAGIHSWFYSSASNSSGAGATATMNEAMRVDSSGKFFVGTTTDGGSDSKIVSGGPISIQYPGNASNYRQLYASSNSNFYFSNGSNQPYISSTGTFTNASDSRLKENITDVKYGLADVEKMRPRSYVMKSNQVECIGFVAQELQTVIPECVSGDDEHFYGVDYGTLTAVLTKAIQEQQALITQLQLDVAALKGAK